jgi:hypothetical protein
MLACTPEVGCRVRARTCCECGASVAVENLMAVPPDSAWVDTALCEPGGGCRACLPAYPDNVEARCGANNFCELVVDGAAVKP